MQRIAEVGRGNYHFVENTADLSALFQRELGQLADTVATDARLVIEQPSGVRIEEAYGHPMSREGNAIVIPIADLRAGETRKVVLRVTIAQAEIGAFDVSTVRLGWRRVSDGRPRTAVTSVRAEIVDDARAVAASAVPAASQATEEALSARALEEATVVYETQGYEAAKRVLDQRVQAAQECPCRYGQHAEDRAASGDAIESFRAAPASKAMKVGRSKPTSSRADVGRSARLDSARLGEVRSWRSPLARLARSRPARRLALRVPPGGLARVSHAASLRRWRGWLGRSARPRLPGPLGSPRGTGRWAPRGREREVLERIESVVPGQIGGRLRSWLQTSCTRR